MLYEVLWILFAFQLLPCQPFTLSTVDRQRKASRIGELATVLAQREITPPTRGCTLIDLTPLGPVDYEGVWGLQKLIVEHIDATRLSRDTPTQDFAILVEHSDVITLGTGASTSNIVSGSSSENTVKVTRVDRGGEVTWHGPGQLVLYPILNLRLHPSLLYVSETQDRKIPDLHKYLRRLEETGISVAARYGLSASREAGLTGVWIDRKKIAAIGVKVRKGITMHGIAINICSDLTIMRNAIVPCGIADREVAAISDWVPGVTVEDAREHVAAAFSECFDLLPVQYSEPLERLVNIKRNLRSGGAKIELHTGTLNYLQTY